MARCELCDVEAKVLVKKSFNDGTYLDICLDCLSEYENNYLDDPDHERDIELEDR